MGKVKVRTLGGELEDQEKKEQKKKKEEKKLEKANEEPVESTPVKQGPEASEEVSAPKKEKKAKFKKAKRTRSSKYQELKAQTDKTKTLSVSEALSLLEKLQRKTFDETVELHLNTSDPKIQVSTTLPHGAGKSLKVAIATDDLIAQVEKGKIDFDILLAEPSMMPKLAKVAKVLGPKGLMPNPKNGTIVGNPEEAAKKYEGGLTFIKTESKAPIVHVAVGKVSFGPKKLEENIDAVLGAVKKENIKTAILKSTMSPAIRLQV